MGRKYSDNSSSSNLSLQSPKFFKIIVDPEDDKLRIPTGFIRKYGRGLPDKVTLKAPNGSVMQVELVQLDGETWFHSGWGTFKDYYEISIGDMLVFEYDGKLHFDVFIFDMTALEIEYPPADDASEDDQVPEMEVSESESDDSAAFLKEAPLNLKRKRRNNHAVGKGRGAQGQVSNKHKTTISDKEACVAYQRAKAFKSNNPSCIWLMQPSYVTSKSASIPLDFARKHLPEQRNQLRLSIKKKGIWTLSCYVLHGKAKMQAGWRKFVEDNALKVGDACVFEVNKCEKLLWNVTIFREPKTVVDESESEDSDIILEHVCIGPKGDRKTNYGKEECVQMKRITDTENCRTYRMARELVFDNPIFIRIMQPSYVAYRFCLSVPLSFAKEHLPAKQNKLKLQVQGMTFTWSVTCVIWPCSATMSSGWKEFVKDNVLKVGDTCVFEVNKHKKCLWNVTIVRS